MKLLSGIAVLALYGIGSQLAALVFMVWVVKAIWNWV